MAVTIPRRRATFQGVSRHRDDPPTGAGHGLRSRYRYGRHRPQSPPTRWSRRSNDRATPCSCRLFRRLVPPAPRRCRGGWPGRRLSSLGLHAGGGGGSGCRAFVWRRPIGAEQAQRDTHRSTQRHVSRGGAEACAGSDPKGLDIEPVQHGQDAECAAGDSDQTATRLPRQFRRFRASSCVDISFSPWKATRARRDEALTGLPWLDCRSDHIGVRRH